MAKLKIASSGAELKALLLSEEDGFRSVPQAVIQETLEAEMTEALQAHKGERAGARLVTLSKWF
jgi:transposase-like protein